ncbi:oxygen-evolving enhancer protein 1 precursor [Thalassiosira pseudonana CCMP1335]|jgi:photosystem II oxygen-evolving enhancer protein 1|uniref:Oxygen-evolving enhancer protein 1 n=1 Tax=Thalassiosira pseudonana TaxID=35128 RepID=B8C4I5_THAPS|nr:oxygen-evolving enhancer protein 1 precursor [Thalassiosira pseudonana CCMP1335]EED91332.1 oxygen-evolving enhancer protein 1 precursor [Thalassiosira pseudonana CCMP1335]8IWH_O Chain O, Oxygen-evolving enhancer protein 1 [Thalassiosira pseudonana]8IWH_o Chain o, Oxygen-evolving enhancer protein 1 [Thalassiosira pseudonana]
MKLVAALSLVAGVSAFAPAQTNSRSTQLNAMKDDIAKVGAAALASAAIFGITAAPAQAITKSELNQLSYLQVKGTGLANRCSEVIGEDTITPKSGARLVDMCIEPKAWAVEEEIGKAGKTEKKFVNSKVMTRQTYTLEGIEGSLKTDGGKIVFTEEEGIDYAPTTVQLPGGERVPFLFTVKELVATGNGGAFKPGFQMGGDFSVPSYRTGLFLDPKGRGGVTGYDMAVALPGLQSGEEGDAELFKENNKTFEVGNGRIEMEVNKVNAEESEIGGVFVASQSGDTDMGSKVPKKILTKGIFYAKIQ